MNIHPLFVHFPIGLLVVYALLEVVIRGRLASRFPSLVPIKGFLAVMGALASYLTVITGEMAEEAIQGTVSIPDQMSRLIETHSAYAVSATIVFSVLAVAYLVYFIERTKFASSAFAVSSPLSPIWRVIQRLSRIMRETALGPVLALVGLILITITGGLGASIVYGPDIDPFVRFIYTVFFGG